MQLRIKLGKTVFYILITALAVLWLIPVYFMVFTAVKTNQELFSNPLFAVPKNIQWSNFADAWKGGNMNIYMKNSFIIAVIKVPLGILVAAFAAFGLTRLRLKGSLPWFIFFLVGMMIPFQATLVPLNIMLNKANLLNSYVGLIIVYIGFGIPFAILILRGFFRAIPGELDEAARIDGCSHFRLFWNIILPIAMPALSTLFILDFLATWNEFLLAQIFITKDDMRTVPTGLLSFKGKHSTNYPLMNAGVLLSVIPVFIVYLIFQRHFVKGFSGAVKG